MFIRIAIEVILPVFILIALGLLMDRIFTLDITTLNRIIFNILIPVIVYHSIVSTALDPEQLGIVAAYTLVSTAVMAAIGWALFSLKPLKENRFEALYALIFTNTGNFGIPVMLMAFGDAGVSVISTMLVTGTLVFFTAGLLIADKKKTTLGGAALSLVKNPTIIALILGLIMRAGGWALPAPLQMPLDTIRGGFVAISLIALGAQIGRIRIGHRIVPVLVTTAARLLGGPALGAAIAAVMGVNGVLAPMLIVGSAMPTAVVTFVVMAEYDRDAEFTSQVILLTTVLAAITMPLVILTCGGAR